MNEEDVLVQLLVMSIENGINKNECHVTDRGAVVWNPDAITPFSTYYVLSEQLRLLDGTPKLKEAITRLFINRRIG